MSAVQRYVPALLLAALCAAPGAAHAAGMPQLDFSTPLTIAQVVWGAIIFALLYVLVSRWGLPQVETVLAHRASVIASDLDAARSAKGESDSAVRELTEATAQARSEAQLAVNAAMDEAKRAAQTQAAAVNARLDEQLRSAETEIAQARATAMAALPEVATDAATALIARLTGRAADPAAVSAEVARHLAPAQG